LVKETQGILGVKYLAIRNKTLLNDHFCFKRGNSKMGKVSFHGPSCVLVDPSALVRNRTIYPRHVFMWTEQPLIVTDKLKLRPRILRL
jgi:hypothetical protein